MAIVSSPATGDATSGMDTTWSGLKTSVKYVFFIYITRKQALAREATKRYAVINIMLPARFNSPSITCNSKKSLSIYAILVNQMKFKPLCLAMVTAGIMAIGSSAHASPIANPIVSVSIGDESGANMVAHTFGSLNWLASPTTLPDILLDLTPTGRFWQNDGATFNLDNAKYDKDPQLNFAVTAFNGSSVTKSYTFSFETPLVPNLVGTITSHAEMTIALTAPTTGPASVQPLFGAGTMLKSHDLYSDGSSISKNVDIGTLFQSTGGTATSASIYANSSLFCAAAGCENMVSVLTFTLTKGASVTFTGLVSQVDNSPTLPAVPVPGAAGLFGSALTGLISFRRKQQNV